MQDHSTVSDIENIKNVKEARNIMVDYSTVGNSSQLECLTFSVLG